MMKTTIRGEVGRRLDGCLARSVKAFDGRRLAAVFEGSSETQGWQTEFWGKWMLGAVPLAHCRPDEAALCAEIAASVETLLAAQRPNGYLGNYAEEAQATGSGWDIWGRKYAMLGLLCYYDFTGDASARDAVCRVADHLMTQVGEGPGRKAICATGMFKGMPSASILGAFVRLWRCTGEPRYRAFADFIVSQLEDAEDGPHLISKALAGVDVGSRFPFPAGWERWWSRENGMKAYEMMSCYKGLAEYAEATGDSRCLASAVAAARNILATEINVAGSGSAFECWYHGAARETIPAHRTMETCVTVTWLLLCGTLLRLTHDPIFADAFEQTFHNAFLAALACDGSDFCKYLALEGVRTPGEAQCGMELNCCTASGPRGFVALLEHVLSTEEDGVYVNLYVESYTSVSLATGGPRVTVEQKTAYPADGAVRLTVRPDRAEAFTLHLRMPAWCARAGMRINSEAEQVIEAGAGFFPIHRLWQPGDTVELTFDMPCRVVRKDGHFALFRGPVLLARDARFGDGDIHAPIEPPDVLTPIVPPSPEIGQAFSARLRTGVDLEAPGGQTPREIHFCDFASAGNTWDADSVYRTWLREPLDVMLTPWNTD